MGWRFRKSFKILPGIRFNINKKSVGITFGGKGLHYTVNSKGKHTASAGIPGTGLYYTESYTAKKAQAAGPVPKGKASAPKRTGCLSLCLCVIVFLLFISILISGFSPESYDSVDSTISSESKAEKTEENKQLMYTTANLNVRTGPGVEYDIISTLEAGQEITVLAQQDDWAEIEYPQSPAYVSTSYIAPNPPAEETTQTDEGPMVWVSYYGSKYHSTPYCSGMKGPSEMSLKEAQRLGKTPCSRCH